MTRRIGIFARPGRSSGRFKAKSAAFYGGIVPLQIYREFYRTTPRTNAWTPVLHT